jgi:50S ribosomal protein L16 3-hydroxylase
MNAKSQLLGGLAPRHFLRRYWQKRPLFVRGALPDFSGVITAPALFRLAMRDDVESRVVERGETRHGPFRNLKASASRWTLLVNGVNLHVPGADELLQRFHFVPQARLDDVMVSYATPSGGVGPHVDSYDVFLLQGPGRRRWRVGSKTYIARPGDMIYVPPGVRHDGVALETCFTYSIGFRAPRGGELGAAFLDWLHERGLPDRQYRDPGLRPTKHPGAIPPEMLRYTISYLSAIRWSRRDAVRFLGEYLSEPKAHVVFEPRPARRALARSIVRLDPRSRFFYIGRRFFMNGEMVEPSGDAAALRELADRRAAEGSRLARGAAAGLISSWQKSGYVHFEGP